MNRHASVFRASCIALASTLLWTAQASATVMKIEFTGIFSSTTDATGTMFGNGTGANSGAGTSISGYALWDLSRPGIFGPYAGGTANLMEWDKNGCYCDPAADPIRTWLTIGGVEYSPDLNLGTRNTVNVANKPDQDSWSQSMFSSGHNPLEPEANGVFDYLSVDRKFTLGFTDPSGLTLNDVDFSQPFEWMPGSNGSGMGSFNFQNQLWTDGTSERYSGTPGEYLLNASGSFVLTSLRASQVPEPGTLALFAAAGLMFVVVRRRAPRWKHQ